MKRSLLIIALCLPFSAVAQVYKCQEGGRTVYSQEPCGKAPQIVDTTPATGSFDADAAMQRRAQNETIMRKQAVDDIQRKLNRDLANIEHQAARNAEARRCDRMRSELSDAKRWSKEFKHPDNIRREEERAKELSSRQFFECR